MKCPKCNIDLTGDDTFCPECGHKISKEKNTKLYLLLAIFGVIIIVLVVFLLIGKPQEIEQKPIEEVPAEEITTQGPIEDNYNCPDGTIAKNPAECANKIIESVGTSKEPSQLPADFLRKINVHPELQGLENEQPVGGQLDAASLVTLKQQFPDVYANAKVGDFLLRYTTRLIIYDYNADVIVNAINIG